MDARIGLVALGAYVHCAASRVLWLSQFHSILSCFTSLSTYYLFILLTIALLCCRLILQTLIADGQSF